MHEMLTDKAKEDLIYSRTDEISEVMDGKG